MKRWARVRINRIPFNQSCVLRCADDENVDLDRGKKSEMRNKESEIGDYNYLRERGKDVKSIKWTIVECRRSFFVFIIIIN